MKTRSHREQAQRTQRTCRLCGHEGADVHRADLRGPNGRKQTIPVCEECRGKVERENARLQARDDDRSARREAAQRAREAYRRQGRS